MNSVTLFDLKNDDIHINISAYFEGDVLVVEGYDIGKTVEEFWGDSDYEYVVKIPAPGVEFLYKHLEIAPNDQQKLLEALASRYNTNFCYSEIVQLLDDHKIKYGGFTWT